MLGAACTMNGWPPTAFCTRQKYSRRIVDVDKMGASNTDATSYCVVTSGGCVFGEIVTDTMFGGAAVVGTSV